MIRFTTVTSTIGGIAVGAGLTSFVVVDKPLLLIAVVGFIGIMISMGVEASRTK